MSTRQPAMTPEHTVLLARSRTTLRARLRQRGFSHISLTIEAAGVMGWFVMTILSQKYLNDAATSRRAAENAAEQGSVASASSFCQAEARRARSESSRRAGRQASSATGCRS